MRLHTPAIHVSYSPSYLSAKHQTGGLHTQTHNHENPETPTFNLLTTTSTQPQIYAPLLKPLVPPSCQQKMLPIPHQLQPSQGCTGPRHMGRPTWARELFPTGFLEREKESGYSTSYQSSIPQTPHCRHPADRRSP